MNASTWEITLTGDESGTQFVNFNVTGGSAQVEEAFDEDTLPGQVTGRTLVLDWNNNEGNQHVEVTLSNDGRSLLGTSEMTPFDPLKPVLRSSVRGLPHACGSPGSLAGLWEFRVFQDCPQTLGPVEIVMTTDLCLLAAEGEFDLRGVLLDGDEWHGSMSFVPTCGGSSGNLRADFEGRFGGGFFQGEWLEKSDSGGTPRGGKPLSGRIEGRFLGAPPSGFDFGAPVEVGGLNFTIGGEFALADFDRNGSLDMAVLSCSSCPYPIVLSNTGVGTFFVSDELPPVSGGIAAALCAGDFDGDGWPDLVISARQGFGLTDVGGLHVYRNAGNGTFEDDEYIEVTSLGDVASIHINGTGRDGLVVLRESGSELLEFQNTSSSFDIRLTLQGTYGVNASPLSKLAVADFDGNGEMDVAMTTPGRVLLRRLGLFIAGPPFSLAGSPTSVDIDGDADQDLISASFFRQWNLVRNAGSGRFGALEQVSTTSQAHSAGAGDFDGDGDQDVVVFVNDETLEFFRNDGAAFSPFGKKISFPNGAFQGIEAFAAADLDGDGDKDLLAYGGAGLFTLINLRE